MIPAYVVQITTPKEYILNGLWLGPKKPKRVVIWIHGLGSSMFSKLNLVEELVDSNTAVFTFNNRGFERVAQIRKTSDSKSKRLLAGAAHERFVDCVDDIQGAVNFAKRAGVKNIYLAGHSTGCQKSIYWASKNGKGVKGVVLLAPVSDLDAMRRVYGTRKLLNAIKVARTLVKRGRKNELMPKKIWPETFDAQRFLSLATPESVEQSVFPYFDTKRRPQILLTVKLPVLAFLAEQDEFGSAKRLTPWFQRYLGEKNTIVIPKVKHSFKGGEKQVAKVVRTFMKEV